jgi:D-alanine transaminase
MWTRSGSCDRPHPGAPIRLDVIVYLNGEFIPVEEARISPLDRGFLFGDGIYEGLRTFAGRVHTGGLHVERLARGLAETGIECDAQTLPRLCEQLAKRNDMPDAFVYVQYTRGLPGAGDPPRMRVPTAPTQPTVFGLSMAQPSIDACETIQTPCVKLCQDHRWLKGQIKSTSLLGNVLAALEGKAAGADEALLHRGPILAEATSSNVILALPQPDGSTELVTPALDSAPILAGVTRAKLLELDPTIIERPVETNELKHASEVILCGTTALVSAVTHVDGRPVGDATPGPHAQRLLHLYLESIRTELGLNGAARELVGSEHG